MHMRAPVKTHMASWTIRNSSRSTNCATERSSRTFSGLAKNACTHAQLHAYGTESTQPVVQPVSSPIFLAFHIEKSTQLHTAYDLLGSQHPLSIKSCAWLRMREGEHRMSGQAFKKIQSPDLAVDYKQSIIRAIQI